MVAAAYCLHNIYSALENCFDQVSRTFENHIVNQSHWHRELLWKMFLDLSPLRPAVMPEAAKPLLDEMLAFRHRFRNNYGMQLNSAKVAALRDDWRRGATVVNDALRAFVSDLRAAAASQG